MNRPYTRVHLYLPLTIKSIPLIQPIIKELYPLFKGLTHTKTNKPTPFIGYYLDDTNKLWIDQVICIYIDIDSENPFDWENYFMDFKKKYEKDLGECKIWIMNYPVDRIVPENEQKNCKEEVQRPPVII